MTTNKSMYVLALLLGSAVLIAGIFLLPDTEQKILPGLLMVVGAGLLGFSVPELLLARLVNPQQRRQIEIEAQDERNVTINYHAKARTFDGMDAVFVVLIVSLILMGVERIGLFMVMGAYGIRWALYVFFLNKYQRRM